MLRIYGDVQAMQLDARRLCDRIGGHDRQLASQLRRSAQSVALNMAEGMASRGGHRRQAYGVALREAKECVAAIDVAGRWGYVKCDEAVLDRLDKIVATLMRLTAPRS